MIVNSIEEEKTIEESKIYAAQNISKQQLYLVKLRSNMKNKRVHKLLMRTPQERKALINSILKA